MINARSTVNRDIRESITRNGLNQIDVAIALDISPSTLQLWLRYENDCHGHRDEILQAIDKLSEGRIVAI